MVKEYLLHDSELKNNTASAPPQRERLLASGERRGPAQSCQPSAEGERKEAATETSLCPIPRAAALYKPRLPGAPQPLAQATGKSTSTVSNTQPGLLAQVPRAGLPRAEIARATTDRSVMPRQQSQSSGSWVRRWRSGPDGTF